MLLLAQNRAISKIPSYLHRALAAGALAPWCIFLRAAASKQRGECVSTGRLLRRRAWLSTSSWGHDTRGWKPEGFGCCC
ncbi:hypothetical protein KC338_g291 [Hortaea werneckii]|nr:hypothetical protein KC338_g291 [Hortaea werneckii]